MIKIKVLLMIVFVIFGIISLIKGINLYEEIKKNKSSIRCIECRLVKERLEEGRPYASTHYTFQALDINVKGWSAKDVYEEILKNQNKFKYIKRMENIVYTPTWTHIDNKDVGKTGIYIFNP